MSENESFIDEVTEEVRRDKLYLFLRKYGWLAGILILLIIFGSVGFEIKSNQTTKNAEKFGDLLSGSLDNSELGEVALYNQAVESLREESLASLLLKSKHFEQSLEYENAKVSYETIIIGEQYPAAFKELAKFKLLLLIKDDLKKGEKILNELITPDNPFRLLALEQKLLMQLKEKKWKEAQDNLELLRGDPEASQGLQTRLRQIENAFPINGL